MTDLQERRLQILEDTVKYYSEDPSERRCIGGYNTCYYSGETIGKNTEGCALGRLLSPELRLELDNKYTDNHATGLDSSAKTVFHELPVHIQELGLWFLERLQKLHDTHSNWVSIGLSDLGYDTVEQFKNEIENENIVTNPEEYGD